MTSRFILPLADVGAGITPSSGAQLFFYETGTTTPKDTYSDAAGTTPNANPVVANAVGVFDDIFISGTYNVVLKNSDGVQQWAADPVTEYAHASDLPDNNEFVKSFATLAAATADTNLKEGDAVNLAERTAGNGGGAKWDVIAGTGTANSYNIVAHDTLSLSFVLRVGHELALSTYGALVSINNASLITSAMAYASTAGKGVVIDDLYPITTAITIPAGLKVRGLGYHTGFSVDTTGISMINVTGSNVTLSDFKVYGKASGGIQIRASADSFIIENTTIDNIIFESIDASNKLNQCIWLYGSKNTKVLNCDFNGTGYGVILQFGYTGDDVLIDGCSFEDMRSDAVEANSGGVVISYRWTVTNCRYMGDARYPYNGPEGRFVGTASVYDCVISNNTVINAGGDSAVHIESSGGRTVITGNTFKDCFGANGNDGWIYILNTPQDFVITGNTFIYENDSGAQSAISISSSNMLNKAVIADNLILDISGLYRFVAFAIKSIQGGSNVVISGNSGSGLQRVAVMVGTKKVVFSSNSFGDCVGGVIHESAGNASASSDNIISNNYIQASGNALEMSRNASALQPPTGNIVSGNRFDGDVVFTYSVDCNFSGNMLGSGFTIDKSSGTRLIYENNNQIGIGLLV